MENLGYGARLSDEEYDRRVFKLHEGLPPIPAKAQELEVRRQELELAIDHRLGLEFPQEKRAQLWRVLQRLESKRLLLVVKHLLRRLILRKEVTAAQLYETEGLAALMVREFAAVLSQREIRSFFDLEPGERPSLPLDPRHWNIGGGGNTADTPRGEPRRPRY